MIFTIQFRFNVQLTHLSPLSRTKINIPTVRNDQNMDRPQIIIKSCPPSLKHYHRHRVRTLNNMDMASSGYNSTLIG